MWLLENGEDGDIHLTDVYLGAGSMPRYATMSHTWGRGEIQFATLLDDTDIRYHTGYPKIKFCAERAAQDGLKYFWIGSCCIDDSSSFELSESINSMYQWLQGAAKCYVYLTDVSTARTSEIQDPVEAMNELLQQFRASRWFTRTWTLQELVAPASVEFYSCEGVQIGDKQSLEQEIHEITGIAKEALRGRPISAFTVVERLSWTYGRTATKVEDLIYPLLGLFEITLPLLYGEGEAACDRFTEEVVKSSEDYSILLCIRKSTRLNGWNLDVRNYNRMSWEGLKVHHPFDLMTIELLAPHLPPSRQVPGPFQVTRNGIRVSLYVKQVYRKLICWTYCTKEEDGQYFAVCIGARNEGAIIEANRPYVKGILSGHIYNVKVNRLRGFELRDLYLDASAEDEEMSSS